MMTRYNVRDVGRKDISLGIETENIDMMGSNTSIPIVREENLMELTYVVDRDYYQQEHPRLQARP